MKRFLFAFVYGVLTFGAVSGANAYTVTYSCGTATGTAPTDSTNYDSDATVTVKPNSCDVPSGQHFAGYVCGSTNVAAGNKFTISGNTTCTAQWKNGKFSVTTTNLNADDTFKFYISAKGTFYVDCGEDGSLTSNADPTDVSNGNTITRSDTTAQTYTCTYTTGGSKTIRFDGVATEYNTTNTVATIRFYIGADATEALANTAKIASITGKISTVFPQLGTTGGYMPRFYVAFYGAVNLTSLPEDLFNGYTKAENTMFQSTFQGCTGLTSIPENLFSTFTTAAGYMFSATFKGCTGLTSIPENLFNSITTATSRNYMFNETFSGCTGITALPEKLFKKITVGSNHMFEKTFSGCTGLTTIPSDLFSGLTTSVAKHMFYQTFEGCTGLTSIPSTLFSRLRASDEYMFYQTFRGCTGLTSIPSDLFASLTSGAYGLFSGTFYGCTGLTALPSSLFATLTTGNDYMFSNTFYNCSGLRGYIPPSMFTGFIANNVSYSSNMMNNTFYGTGLATSCDNYDGTTKFDTPYDSYWSGKVSCRPTSCDNGYTMSYGVCVGNTISIVWNGASSEDIAANNAGTTTYGGDIRTPRAATPIPGKIFRGWKFVKPNQN